jgi:hypothetical protein
MANDDRAVELTAQLAEAWMQRGFRRRSTAKSPQLTG